MNDQAGVVKRTYPQCRYVNRVTGRRDVVTVTNCPPLGSHAPAPLCPTATESFIITPQPLSNETYNTGTHIQNRRIIGLNLRFQGTSSPLWNCFIVYVLSLLYFLTPFVKLNFYFNINLDSTRYKHYFYT